MTLLYYDPRFLDHDTGDHPECAQRLRHIMAELDARGLTDRCRRPTWQPADRDRLTSLHDAEQVDSLEKFAERGGGRVDPDTVVSPPSIFQNTAPCSGDTSASTRWRFRSLSGHRCSTWIRLTLYAVTFGAVTVGAFAGAFFVVAFTVPPPRR